MVREGAKQIYQRVSVGNARYRVTQRVQPRTSVKEYHYGMFGIGVRRGCQADVSPGSVRKKRQAGECQIDVSRREVSRRNVGCYG